MFCLLKRLSVAGYCDCIFEGAPLGELVESTQKIPHIQISNICRTFLQFFDILLFYFILAFSSSCKRFRSARLRLMVV